MQLFIKNVEKTEKNVKKIAFFNKKTQKILLFYRKYLEFLNKFHCAY